MFKSRKIVNLRKQLKQSQDLVDRLRDANEELINECSKNAVLISIERDGHHNVFSFVRNDEFFEIKTYHMLADDLNAWKQSAGLV